MSKPKQKPLIIVLTVSLICFTTTFSNSLPNAQTSTPPTGTVTIGPHTFTVEIAESEAIQTQGLSGRKKLTKNSGMYFVYPDSQQRIFWMKDMKFALDMLWINKNTLVGISENLPTPLPGTPSENLVRYYSPQPVDGVLEVNAGTVAANQIKVGDAVSYTPSP